MYRYVRKQIHETSTPCKCSARVKVHCTQLSERCLKLEYTVCQMINMRCVLKHISPIFGRNVCRGVVLCKVRRVRTHLLSAHLPRVSKHHNAS